jgi:hypothetical protein
MKIIFIVYHDILEDRVSNLLDELKIDYFTEWENVKGKGHHSEAHLGTRTYPGFNTVRMIAFQDDKNTNGLIEGVVKLNSAVMREDDKIRLFQMPLEKIL